MNPPRQLTTRTSRKRILGPISTGGWDGQTLLPLSVASNQGRCDEVEESLSSVTNMITISRPVFWAYIKLLDRLFNEKG